MSVLVLCTGNSCRSQMAEGFLRSFGISVQSAGVESHGMNNYAIKVMAEIGIDITNQHSKTINEIDLQVWERGAGATLACGTGACAAALAWWQHKIGVGIRWQSFAHRVSIQRPLLCLPQKTH